MPTPESIIKDTVKSADQLKSISHPLRLLIIELLTRPGSVPKRVSEVTNELGHPQPIVSQHLILLKDRGILLSSKVGTSVYYRPALKGLYKLLQAVNGLTQEGVQ